MQQKETEIHIEPCFLTVKWQGDTPRGWLKWVMWFTLDKPLTSKRISTTLQMIKAETLNHVIKEGLLDLAICYLWRDIEASADSLFQFRVLYAVQPKISLSIYLKVNVKFRWKKMLQISMNGPNVNWSFLKNIADRLKVLLTDKHPELAKFFNLRSIALRSLWGF